jgi:hypothetical protein
MDEKLDALGASSLPFDVVGEVDVGLLPDLLLSLVDDVILELAERRVRVLNPPECPGALRRSCGELRHLPASIPFKVWV